MCVCVRVRVLCTMCPCRCSLFCFYVGLFSLFIVSLFQRGGLGVVGFNVSETKVLGNTINIFLLCCNRCLCFLIEYVLDFYLFQIVGQFSCVACSVLNGAGKDMLVFARARIKSTYLLTIHDNG